MMVPKNLREVKEQSLAGYQLKTGYALILKHGCMGTFPALIADAGPHAIVVCTDRKVLEKVWEKLPKQPARLIELQLYVNDEEAVGFNVEVGNDAEPMSILNEELFAELAAREGAFKWASGLVSLSDEQDIQSPFL